MRQSSLDKHDLELECQTLGAMFLSAEAAADCVALLRPPMFFSEPNGRIFEIMASLVRDERPIDFVTVKKRIKPGDKFDVDYLVRITESVASAGNALHYARGVHELWQRREVGKRMREIEQALVSDQPMADIFQRVKAADFDLHAPGYLNGAGNLPSLAAFEEEEATYLWDPWLRAGQINLLDAMGSSGKTTVCIALAAAGANGCLPWVERHEPFNTLFFFTEDTAGEMRSIFRQVGGEHPERIIPYTEHLELDDRGLAKVLAMIVRYDAKLVVFDPITNYLPARIQKAFDNIAISKVLTGLREVMRQTGACGLDIRHFNKAKQGDMQDWGTGGAIWRDSHRRQLVLIPHRELRGHGALFPRRGSLVDGERGGGEPFGFSREGGIFGWIAPENLRIEDYIEVDARKGGPVADTPAETIRTWLIANVPTTWTPSKTIETAAKADGIKMGGTWTRVKKEVCQSAQFGDGWNICLRDNATAPKEVDPFEDP